MLKTRHILRMKPLLLLLLLSGTAIATFAQDWPNLNHYQMENHQLGSPHEGEQRIVFFGNSITEAWSSLSPSFFVGKPYINRGIGGQTTAQMLLRFRTDVIDLKPAVVVILAGTNDIAGNTGPVTLEQIGANMESLIQLARFNGIHVVVCSVLPAFDYPWKPGQEPARKIPLLNSILQTVCERNSADYLDLFTPLATPENGMKSAYSEDGVHPNPKGYAVMEPLVEQALLRITHQNQPPIHPIKND